MDRLRSTNLLVQGRRPAIAGRVRERSGSSARPGAERAGRPGAGRIAVPGPRRRVMSVTAADADGRVARPVRREHPAGCRPVEPGRVRLTRRGRAVVVAFFLLLAGVGAAFAAPASRAADPEGPAPTAVVQPGDTLWSITERYAPGRDPFGVIQEIRRLNGLNDYTVHAGQRLTLPRRG